MEKIVVGSSEECNVKIANDFVSRRHCMLVYEADEVWVKDLGSSNGTFVDGEQVRPNSRKRVPPSSYVSLAEEVVLEWKEIQSFRPSRHRERDKRGENQSFEDRASEEKNARRSQGRARSSQESSGEKKRSDRGRGKREKRNEEKERAKKAAQSSPGRKTNESQQDTKRSKDGSKNELPMTFRQSWLNFVPHILFFWLIFPIIIAIWKRMSMVLKLEDERITLERGVLSKERKQIFMSDVRAIDIKKSLLQRIFGIGDIMIATAGTGDYEDVAEGLPQPEKVKQIINQHRKNS